MTKLAYTYHGITMENDVAMNLFFFFLKKNHYAPVNQAN